MADKMKAAAEKAAAEFGYVVEQTVIYIDRQDLNEEGLGALEAYRAREGSVPTRKDGKTGRTIEMLPIGVNFPFPAEGLETHLDPAFLADWRAKWNKEVMGRGIRVELNLDKFVKGQVRIDLNRDRTPTAYKRFGKAVGTSSKAGSKTAAVKVSSTL